MEVPSKSKVPPRRIQKTLYLAEDLERQLRMRVAELSVQHSDIAADALTASFAPSRPRKGR